MDDLSFGIDKKCGRAEPVDNICKGGSLGLSEIDNFARAHGAAHVRHDQRQSAAHFFVDHAARLTADDGEIQERHSRYRSSLAAERLRAHIGCFFSDILGVTG